MRIYLVRHAQSEWQVRPSEDWDTALTPIGHEQARCLARWLATCPEVGAGLQLEVSSLSASPFRRAQQTAAYVAEALGLPIVTHDSLREATFHVASHLPESLEPLDDGGAFMPSREYGDFRRQAQSALEFLVAQAELARGPALAVTHGGLIKTLLRSLTGDDRVCFSLFNACVSLIEWRRGRWHFVHLNLSDHLAVRLRTR